MVLLTKEPNMKEAIERELAEQNSDTTVHKVEIDTLGLQVIGSGGIVELTAWILEKKEFLIN